MQLWQHSKTFQLVTKIEKCDHAITIKTDNQTETICYAQYWYLVLMLTIPYQSVCCLTIIANHTYKLTSTILQLWNYKVTHIMGLTSCMHLFSQWLGVRSRQMHLTVSTYRKISILDIFNKNIDLILLYVVTTSRQFTRLFHFCNIK